MPSSSRSVAEVDSPIGTLQLGPIEPSDLQQVLEIERVSFPSPWRREHFLHEMQFNPRAWLRRLRRKDRVLAYACMWRLSDELRINNLAVHPGYRRRGLARLLLDRVLREGAGLGCRRATLEVRPSNRAARQLYRSHGFVEIGRRADYYADEGEDAILMQLGPLRGSGRG